MTIDPEEYRRRFDQLTDEALLEIDRDDLNDDARAAYDSEVSKRGIQTAMETDAPESLPAAAKEGMALAAEFTSAQEAAFARSLLKSAGIPYYARTDSGVLGTIEEELQVFVPPEYLDQAQQLLSTPLSDEELARQAEAAGSAEEIEEEELEEGENEPSPEEDIQL